MKRNCIFCILIFVLLCGCTMQNNLPSSAEKLLRTIQEAPNGKLYDPKPVEIGLEEDAPNSTQNELLQVILHEEREAWKNEVGGCFAGEMFDTFWGSPERTYFLGVSGSYGITVKEMEVIRNEDYIQHVRTVLNVSRIEAKDSERKEIVTEWRIIYDKEQPELIQSLELMDDGGFGEWTAED